MVSHPARRGNVRSLFRLRQYRCDAALRLGPPDAYKSASPWRRKSLSRPFNGCRKRQLHTPLQVLTRQHFPRLPHGIPVGPSYLFCSLRPRTDRTAPSSAFSLSGSTAPSQCFFNKLTGL